MKFSIKDIVLVAACISIVFVQEQVLAFLPNIQLTVLLLVIYSKKLGLIKTTIIILIHTLLDCLVNGSINLYYFPFMFLGWMSIPVIINILFKRTESPIFLSLAGVFCSFIYSWIFIIPNLLVANSGINLSMIYSYFVADIWFELLLICSSFVSILWLYTPSSMVLDKILNEYYK